MKYRYIEIQKSVINHYKIELCDGSKCKNDWSRMHAHVKQRRICKWKPKNSIQATFDLFHEIGHIETTKSNMRRCEEEYYATMWAIKKCNEFDIEIPQKTIDLYQNYINEEHARGVRRGGKLPPVENFRLEI